jgi:hypothetical protein
MLAAATAPKYDSLNHEEFCLPRPDEDAPRIEGFVSYSDDPQTGRSRPTAFVTRCLECGVAKYRPID